MDKELLKKSNNCLKDLQIRMEVKKGIMYDGYESPEPGDISDKEKEILSHTYSSCRKNGGDKTKCSKIAWGAVNNYRNKN